MNQHAYDCAGNRIIVSDREIPPRNHYDQVIVLKRVQLADPSQRNVEVAIYNNNGSRAGNCLNGLQAAMHSLIQSSSELNRDEDKVLFSQGGNPLATGFVKNGTVGVYVPFPQFFRGARNAPDRVILGNHHAVYWTLKRSCLRDKGYKPPHVNEEHVLERSGENGATLKVVVYEAHVGKTGSCGSGAVAVGTAAHMKFHGNYWDIAFPGGNLSVRIEEDQEKGDGKSVYLNTPLKRLS